MKISHLHSSDICWRRYFSFRLKAALALDLKNIGLTNVRMSAPLLQYVSSDKHLYSIWYMSTILGDPALSIHPNFFLDNRVARYGQYLLETYSEKFPCVGFELSFYLSMETPSSYRRYLIRALCNEPTNQRLLYEFMKVSHKAFNGSYILDGVDDAILLQNAIFSPAFNMAIGHFEIIIDYNEIHSAIGNHYPSMEVFDSTFGLGNELTMILRKRIPNLKIQSDLYADQRNVSWWAKAYLCDPHHYWFRASTRQRVRKLGIIKSLQRFHKSEKSVFLHMRTNSYKNADADPQQAIRSVNPGSYQLLVDRLVHDGYTIYVPLNGNEDPGLVGITTFDITSSEGRTLQWEALLQASFMVGTPSGMIHLSGLCDRNAIFTNYTQLPCNMLGAVHLVSLKRFSVSNLQVKHLSSIERIALVVNHWHQPGEPSLTSFCRIRDLSPEDLLDNIEEFYDIATNPLSGCNLCDVLNDQRIDISQENLPDINISRTTKRDLLALLSLY